MKKKEINICDWPSTICALLFCRSRTFCSAMLQEGHSRDSLQEVNMMIPKIQPDRPKSTSKTKILSKVALIKVGD